MKILGAKMSPEILSKNQVKAEYNLRFNYFHSVRDELSRVQGIIIDMQKTSQLLPNKLPKQLNQQNNWKIISTITSAEKISKNQLKAGRDRETKLKTEC